MTQLALPGDDLLDTPLIKRLGDLWMRFGALVVIHGDREDPQAMLNFAQRRAMPIRGEVKGGATLSSRCLVRPDGVDDHIEFPTNFGITNTGGHIVAVLFHVMPGTKVHGALVKIGNASTGFGYGIGGNTFDLPGVQALCLEEAIAWKGGFTGGLNDGVFLVVFAYDNTNHIISYGGFPALAQQTQAKTGPVTPSDVTYINGYVSGGDNRHTETVVHAVGIWSGLGTSSVAALTEQIARQSSNMLPFLNYWVASSQPPSRVHPTPDALY